MKGQVNKWKMGIAADLLTEGGHDKLAAMKLLMDNLPAGLRSQRETLARCLEAMDRAMPLRAVYLFGSHARGDAQPDSDVDLCLVAEGAGRQLEAARKFREAIGDVWPCPAFTLLPITPERLAEKNARHDHFFSTVLKEGVMLASEN
jgi:predicted nucleotidyltransferase